MIAPRIDGGNGRIGIADEVHVVRRVDGDLLIGAVVEVVACLAILGADVLALD